MFKNLSVLKLLEVPEDLEQQLTKAAFVPCTTTEAFSDGWAIARAEAYGYKFGGVTLLHYVSESKSVPATALAQRLKELVDEAYAAQGFMPGRKATKSLKEAATDELLARALPSRKLVKVILLPKDKLLLIDSASNTQVDAIVSKLVRSTTANFESVRTVTLPVEAMTEWLSVQEAPDDFAIGQDAELISPSTEQVIVFKETDLSGTQVQDFLKQDMMVKKLALTFSSALSFVLTDNRAIRRIEALVKDEAGKNDVEDDVFDSELVLTALTMAQLHSTVVSVLDGELST